MRHIDTNTHPYGSHARRTRLITSVVLAVGAIGLTACGGGSDADEPLRVATPDAETPIADASASTVSANDQATSSDASDAGASQAAQFAPGGGADCGASIAVDDIGVTFGSDGFTVQDGEMTINVGAEGIEIGDGVAPAASDDSTDMPDVELSCETATATEFATDVEPASDEVCEAAGEFAAAWSYSATTEDLVAVRRSVERSVEAFTRLVPSAPADLADDHDDVLALLTRMSSVLDESSSLDEARSDAALGADTAATWPAIERLDAYYVQACGF
jgi:hypothetical protein